MREEKKMANFRMTMEELESIKLLATIHDMSQAELIRYLINSEIKRQAEAIDAYQKSIAEIKSKIKK